MTTSEIATLVSSVLAVVFSGAGFAAFYQAKKVADVGEAEVEVKARSAATADWQSVKDYWESEISNLRGLVATLQGQMATIQQQHAMEREADRQHILELESHIWLGKAAPPPARRPTLRTE